MLPVRERSIVRMASRSRADIATIASPAAASTVGGGGGAVLALTRLRLRAAMPRAYAVRQQTCVCALG
jgi:hypothetical protein